MQTLKMIYCKENYDFVIKDAVKNYPKSDVYILTTIMSTEVVRYKVNAIGGKLNISTKNIPILHIQDSLALLSLAEALHSKQEYGRTHVYLIGHYTQTEIDFFIDRNFSVTVTK